jgi:oligoendopeptidase F
MSTATAPTATANALGNLPTWDLADLYPGRDSPALKQDLERMAKEARAFKERHAGKLAGLSGDALAAAIAEYEAMDETLTRIMSFAGLLHAGDQLDPEIGRFYQDTQERVTQIGTDTLFFRLEINKLEDAHLERQLASSAKLAKYRPWLRDVRVFRPHQLSDEIETLLHEKYVAGRAAWTRLFDETMAALKFPIGGKELSSAEALHLLSDRDRAKRREAGESLGRVFEANIRLFGHVTNTLAKDKEIEDKWRKYPTPDASRHLGNAVEPEVVAALTAAVQSAYPKLSHRYYAMKAKWLGLEKLEYWDRNAPLPDDGDKQIAWSEAKDLVLNAYASFSPDLAAIGRRFFDKPWIDAPARPGKSPGAFAHPTVPSAHPYLLLNYLGKTRDVMTLAHELGHGVHQVLAGGQGHFLSDTPLTLAETASVFGEQLTFRALLNREQDPKRRRIMLAQKVEDMINTVLRQIAFYTFEQRVHAARREGELSTEKLGEIWLGVQGESLGSALNFQPEYRHFWCYIPHFIHTPFYVYAYAFGDCLVNSLYAVYEEAKANGMADAFAVKYLDMLRAGGVHRHKELLAPFGLDASDPQFWSKGLAVLGKFIDELEASS